MLIAVGVRVWLRRHRWLRSVRLARGRVGPRYPVVLLHGLLGFDELEIGSARHAYFRGVAENLERLGASVHRPRLSSTAGVALRAAQLVQRIDSLSAKRVNIIAHSMGGLDARYAIARLGLSGRVSSLTTIGTPHRGTPLADLGTALGRRVGAARVLSAMGVEVEAFYDVTRARAERFNRQIQDVPGVSYLSVVARTSASRVHPLLWPSYQYLSARAGPNDGAVPVDSQIWGEVWAQIEADHWAPIGWSRHFDAAALFEELLRELRGRGF